MKISKVILIITLSCILVSCDKEFLEKKPDKSLLVPKQPEHLQALLDNNEVMNITSGLGAIACDDYYLTDAGWQGLPIIEQNAYLWVPDVYQGSTFIADWRIPYQQIFYANVILDAVEATDANTAELQAIRGSALFFRGMALNGLAEIFTAPYDKITAATLPGLPLRSTADINSRPGRGTLKETFDRIISDLQEAKDLVPAQVNYKSRPDKAAVEALLARIYLSMQDYKLAAEHAGNALKLKGSLIDYNTLSPASTRPFPPALPDGNAEILFYTTVLSYTFVNSLTIPLVDISFFNSYESNDLRKTIFFRDRGAGVINFKGSYTGTALSGSNSGIFSGLTTSEVFLIRAEANARNGNVSEALADLNLLLEKRWKKGTFVPVKGTADQVLQRILTERRKELFGRGIRWTDLRRLNKEPQFATTLKRMIKGKEYLLPPNDKLYIFAIPDNEISSDVVQNPR